MQNTKSREVEGELAETIRGIVMQWTSDEVRNNLERIRIINVYANRYRIDFFCKLSPAEGTEMMLPQRKILDSRFCHLEKRSDDTQELVDVTVAAEPKQSGGLW